MSRLNTKGTGRGATSAIRSTPATFGTHEGGVAFERDAKGELFTLGVNYLAGEETFYESAKDREKRFANLVTQVAVEDPAWMFGFLGWLRGTGNVRTASVMGAAIAVHARLADPKSVALDAEFTKAGKPGWNRRIVDVVCQRADEPGEFLAYWTNKYGKPIPQPVKRGLGDAAGRLYNEYSFLKYDTGSHAWRFGDVLNVCHVAPAKGYQHDLFGLAIASRHGNSYDHMLPMITSNENLRKQAVTNPGVLLSAEALRAAGMTWEDSLSLAGNKVDKKALWEAQIESMGYMALLRNLRNFEQAGISAAATQYVASKLMDEEAVVNSRQFPYRFLSAYKNAQGSQWAHPLEVALGYSTQNIPVLNGNHAVLVDTSGSMSQTISNKSQLRIDEAAAVYGVALALKNPGTTRLFGYADGVFEHKIQKGASVLRTVNAFARRNGEVGHGTETVGSVEKVLAGGDYNRITVITDMQAFEDYSYGGYRSASRNRSVKDVVPDSMWLYGFSLGGYRASMIESGQGRVHELSGLTDATFKIVPLLEAGATQSWPWEN